MFVLPLLSHLGGDPGVIGCSVRVMHEPAMIIINTTIQLHVV